MSLNVNTNLQSVSSHISNLLTLVDPHAQQGEIDNSFALSEIDHITRQINEIENELTGAIPTQSNQGRIYTVWKESAIKEVWSQFACQVKEQIDQAHKINASIYNKGQQLAQSIQRLFNDVFISDKGLFELFLSNDQLFEEFIEARINGFKTMQAEYMEPVRSDTISIPDEWQGREILVKRNCSLNAAKAQILGELYEPIVKLASRTISGVYGDGIKQQFASSTLDHLSPSALIKLLLIDRCCFSDLREIQILTIFEDLYLNYDEVSTVRSIREKSNLAIERAILLNEKNDLDFLDVYVERFIEVCKNLDKVSQECIEEIQEIEGLKEELFEDNKSKAQGERTEVNALTVDELFDNFDDAVIFEEGLVTRRIHGEAEESLSEWSMTLQTSFSSVLVSIIEDLLQPSDQTIKELVQVIWQNYQHDMALSLIDKISDKATKARCMHYIVALATTTECDNLDSTLQKTLGLLEKNEWKSFFQNVLEKFLSEEESTVHIYRLLTHVMKSLNRDIKKEFMGALTSFLCSLEEEELSPIFGNPLFTFQQIIGFTQNPEFIRFYLDEDNLRAYYKAILDGYKDAHSHKIEKGRKKLNEAIQKLEVSQETLDIIHKRADEIFEQHQELLVRKEGLLKELYLPFVSLIAHILKGSYGENLREMFLRGSFTQGNEKAYLRLLLIHQVHHEALYSIFSLDQELRERILKLTPQEIIEFVDASDCIADEEASKLLHLIQQLATDSIEHNHMTYGFLKEYFNEEIIKEGSQPFGNAIESGAVSGILAWLSDNETEDDDSSNSLSLEQDEIVRRFGLWNDSNVIDMFFTTVADAFFVDIDCAYLQLKALLSIKDETSCAEYVSQIESFHLKTKYIASYLLHKPRDDRYRTLKLLTSHLKNTNSDEMLAVFYEMIKSDLRHHRIGEFELVHEGASVKEDDAPQTQLNPSEIEWMVDQYIAVIHEMFGSDMARISEEEKRFAQLVYHILNEEGVLENAEELKDKIERLKNHI